MLMALLILLWETETVLGFEDKRGLENFLFKGLILWRNLEL